MTSRNDITGDKLQSKVPSKEYKDNWDLIFGKKEESKNEDSNIGLGEHRSTTEQGTLG